MTWLVEWLKGKWHGKPECAHRWRILIEYYPTFASNKWHCKKCGKTENFPDSEPPVKVKHDICSLGHLHIVNR